MSESKVRIIIADDHPIFRDGLRLLLCGEDDFIVIGEAAGGLSAIELATRLLPDILLLDVAMPRVGGLDVLRELAVRAPSIRTVLLTAAIDKSEMIAALKLGARGVVLKEAATPTLHACIRRVMAGEYWVDRGSFEHLVQALHQLTNGTETEHRGRLTPREMAVVAAVVQGMANKTIADRLAVSEQTVKNHLRNIFEKLGVSTRLELALYAVSHDLLRASQQPAAQTAAQRTHEPVK